MNQARFTSLAFLATTAIFLLLAGKPVQADLCSKTTFVKLCRPLLKGIRSPAYATEVATKSLINEIGRARNVLGRSLTPKTADMCRENYDNAIDSLKKALKSLKVRDLYIVSINLSATLTNIVTCDDAIKAASNPVKRINLRLRGLASNCLALAEMTPSH
ncbi:uncharacterized protein LOC110813114 [Carica papaya]|uniref:uncharacterized protein LOC110813114 n=1 Tax=Carica papaya TaxID=3649 RepID=UPI000B8CB83C|nr:uncharacterized protein LOC110813114 [Carica papaya]